MHQFTKILKLLSDAKILKAIGDTSSVIDGLLELESEDRCAVARRLFEYAEALILKAKQNKVNKQEDSSNGTRH
jgi:hypothetical protein